MGVKTTLPTFAWRLETIALAEQGDGWLSVCEDGDRFLLPTQESAAALARFLRPLDAGPILEVCAGQGELAEGLRSMGVPVIATDADPPPGSPVMRVSAEEALRRHQPRVVLACFAPIDAGVDELVMGFPSVRHYVVLGARIGGLFGSAALWQNPSWSPEPLDEVTRWMLTRHDVWLGTSQRTILQHGEAWHWSRNRSNDRNDRDEAVSD